MEARIYGVLDSNNCLIDVSRSERGAKRYATNHGYNKIGYRVGYNAFICAEKINNKWQEVKQVNEFEERARREQWEHEQEMMNPTRNNY